MDSLFLLPSSVSDFSGYSCFSGSINGICDPHMNDGLSLQEMIDSDIQTVFDDMEHPVASGYQNNNGIPDIKMDDEDHLLPDFDLLNSVSSDPDSCILGKKSVFK